MKGKRSCFKKKIKGFKYMKKTANFLESISTIIVMVIVVTTGFVIFNIPIQVLLLISSAYAACIAYRVGLRWEDLEEGYQNA